MKFILKTLATIAITVLVVSSIGYNVLHFLQDNARQAMQQGGAIMVQQIMKIIKDKGEVKIEQPDGKGGTSKMILIEKPYEAKK